MNDGDDRLSRAVRHAQSTFLIWRARESRDDSVPSGLSDKPDPLSHRSPILIPTTAANDSDDVDASYAA